MKLKSSFNYCEVTVAVQCAILSVAHTVYKKCNKAFKSSISVDTYGTTPVLTSKATVTQEYHEKVGETQLEIGRHDNNQGMKLVC